MAVLRGRAAKLPQQRAAGEFSHSVLFPKSVVVTMQLNGANCVSLCCGMDSGSAVPGPDDHQHVSIFISTFCSFLGFSLTHQSIESWEICVACDMHLYESYES